MKKVLCIGQAAYDTTLVLDKYPIENTKIRTDKTVECGGGSAANACALLAKWGMDSSFAGAVGDDLYGKKIIDEFIEIGINIDNLVISNLIETAAGYIISNITLGTRTIIVKEKKMDMLDDKINNNKYDAIMIDGRELEYAKRVLINNKDAITVIDAGNYKKSIIELGKYVKYFVCSHDFAQEYTNLTANANNITSLVKIYDKLVEDFNNNVIITLEASGSFTKYNDEYIIVPSIKVKPIDSTAAGDIYHGALTYFLMNDYDLLKAMKLANITGALSTLKIGGRYSIPTLEEVLNYKEESLDVI